MDDMTEPVLRCQWFALCENEAAGAGAHPILEYVPTCQQCADRFGMELLEMEVVW